MRERLLRSLKTALRSRVIFTLVIVNLCFVAFMVGQSQFEEHGVASCVAPKAGDDLFGCHFPPPPPAWQVVGVVLNAPSILLSSFLTETLEGRFPQLCGVMTFVSLSVLAAAAWVQWTIVGLGALRLIEWAGRKLRRA